MVERRKMVAHKFRKCEKYSTRGPISPERHIRIVYVRHLAETKDLNPKPGCSRAKIRFRVKTKVFCDGIVTEVVNQLGESSDKPNGRKGRQAQVPDGHCTTPIPSRLVFKVIPSIDNADSVERNGNHGQPRIVDHPITKRDGIIV
jgi:hypothetical protein